MAPMETSVLDEARKAPGWREWARREVVLADQADARRLALILAGYVDGPQLPECVGAVMAAGFHR